MGCKGPELANFNIRIVTPVPETIKSLKLTDIGFLDL